MRDVVEILLEAHVNVRQMLARTEGLLHANATEATREAAEQIADFVEWLMPLHREDEDRSIATRLEGKQTAVDAALAEMDRQHLSLEGPLARWKLVTRAISRDVSRLNTMRFELEATLDDLKPRLFEHMALEESLVFPAMKRLLYVDELESIEVEMRQRRSALAA